MDSSSTTLDPNDSVNWAQIGPARTVLSNPATVTTDNGDSVVVSEVVGGAQVRYEGTSFNGNFAPGASLLYTTTSGSGPITLTFAQPVLGVGAQIMADFYDGFTAQLDLYSATNVLLASYQETGDSNGNNDNSAIFIGGQQVSGTPQIAYAVFSVPSAYSNPNDFALGNISLLEAPEPSTWAMLIGGVGLVALWRSRKSRKFEKT